jgi:hypothetical protein
MWYTGGKSEYRRKKMQQGCTHPEPVGYPICKCKQDGDVVTCRLVAAHDSYTGFNGVRNHTGWMEVKREKAGENIVDDVMCPKCSSMDVIADGIDLYCNNCQYIDTPRAFMEEAEKWVASRMPPEVS